MAWEMCEEERKREGHTGESESAGTYKVARVCQGQIEEEGSMQGRVGGGPS